MWCSCLQRSPTGTPRCNALGSQLLHRRCENIRRYLKQALHTPPLPRPVAMNVQGNTSVLHDAVCMRARFSIGTVFVIDHRVMLSSSGAREQLPLPFGWPDATDAHSRSCSACVCRLQTLPSSAVLEARALTSARRGCGRCRLVGS